MPPLAQLVQVDVAERGPEAVGVVEVDRGAVPVLGLEPVPAPCRRRLRRERAALVDPLQVGHRPVLGQHPHGDRRRPQGVHPPVVVPEDAVGVAVLNGYQRATSSAGEGDPGGGTALPVSITPSGDPPGAGRPHAMTLSIPLAWRNSAPLLHHGQLLMPAWAVRVGCFSRPTSMR